MQKRPLWLIQLLHFEYWTWWKFYLPMVPYYLYLAAKTRSLTFFTNVNTCFENAGFFETEKDDILAKISPEYLPISILIKKEQTFQFVLEQIVKNNLTYPVLAKPNIGERGNGVTKIESETDLKNYHAQGFDFLLQEYIHYQTEFALLYYRYPNAAKGTISSLTAKAFLSVTGTGQNTILELMQQTDRARFQIERFQKTNYVNMSEIIPKGQNRILEPIGNHCRGTTFLDSNAQITEKLISTFDQICKPIEGFHYGRFDLRVSSLDELYQGKNIKVLELNGVNADAAHIFDPNYSLLQAYKDVAKHWRVLAEISNIQKANGIKAVPLQKILQLLKIHFFSKND
jgi:hypothetical protein